MEDRVNELLSAAMVFCDLVMEDDVPSRSTLSRFRKELTEKKGVERLLNQINRSKEKKADKKVRTIAGRLVRELERNLPAFSKYHTARPLHNYFGKNIQRLKFFKTGATSWL